MNWLTVMSTLGTHLKNDFFKDVQLACTRIETFAEFMCSAKPSC